MRYSQTISSDIHNTIECFPETLQRLRLPGRGKRKALQSYRKYLYHNITFTSEKQRNHKCYIQVAIFQDAKHICINTERGVPATNNESSYCIFASSFKSRTANTGRVACRENISRTPAYGFATSAKCGRKASRVSEAKMDVRGKFCRQDPGRLAIFTSEVVKAADVFARRTVIVTALCLCLSTPRSRNVINRRRFVLGLFVLAILPSPSL